MVAIQNLLGYQLLSTTDSHYLYNVNNDRMIHLTQGAPEDFLRSELSEDFRVGKPRAKRPFEWQLIGFKVAIAGQKKANLLVDKVLENPKLLMVAVVVQILALMPNLGYVQQVDLKSVTLAQGILGLALSYLIVFLIMLVHEYGHLMVYQKYTQVDQIFWGLELRYGFLLLYYTSVPFVKHLAKRERQAVISAGVANQIVFGSILTVFMGMPQLTMIVASIMVINLMIIVGNLLPFMRLDGYWLLNEWLGTTSYSQDFWQMVKKGQLPPIKIVLLQVLNTIVIIASLLSVGSQVLEVLRLLWK